jgi:predicted MFS family arabinose efflux permease
MVLFTAIFKPLVNSIGFAWTLRIISFIVLAGLLISIIVLKQRPSSNEPRKILDLAAFREARYTVFCIAGFFMFAGAYIPFYYVPVYSQTVLGVSEDLSYDMLAVMAAGSIFGRIIPPYIALRYGSLPVIAFLVFICGLLQFVWAGIHSFGQLIPFALFYGFFSGGVASLAPVATIEMAPSMHVAGTRLGMLLFIGKLFPDFQ